jgi:hypothetical protein
MEILSATHLSVPVFQICLLLLLSTLALIFGRIKLALLINYCFTLYWGYILSIDTFTEIGMFSFNTFTFTYFGFGLVIVFLALIGLFYYRTE